MIVVNGTIELENVDELERLIPALVRRAERSRDDEGNIDYVFARNIENPNEIRLIEKWESQAHLNSHLERPDEEFSKMLETARIRHAVVKAVDVETDKTLMSR